MTPKDSQATHEVQCCNECGTSLVCSCSILTLSSSYRCKMHPLNEAKTPEQQKAFAAAFDARVLAGQKR